MLTKKITRQGNTRAWELGTFQVLTDVLYLERKVKDQYHNSHTHPNSNSNPCLFLFHFMERVIVTVALNPYQNWSNGKLL